MALIFDQPHALAINEARLKHLVSLGLDLENKTVLEVGAGIGRLTHFFEKRGCDVISTEGRPGNIAENLRRHPWRKVQKADLMVPGSHDHFRKFDVVFCYGVLYHVADPASVLDDLAQVCKGLFLLETRVFPKDNNRVHQRREKDKIDQSLDGRGCRPARNWLMAELRKHYKFVYVTRAQPNHHEFALKWPSERQKVRAVFVASRDELDLPTLSDELPMRQKRC